MWTVASISLTDYTDKSHPLQSCCRERPIHFRMAFLPSHTAQNVQPRFILLISIVKIVLFLHLVAHFKYFCATNNNKRNKNFF